MYEYNYMLNIFNYNFLYFKYSYKPYIITNTQTNRTNLLNTFTIYIHKKLNNWLNIAKELQVGFWHDM